jgi:hypothetical protein
MKTKPIPPNGSSQNNHAKVGAQIDMLADADKSVNAISKKAAGTSGPNTCVIAPGRHHRYQATRVMCCLVLMINLSKIFEQSCWYIWAQYLCNSSW